MTLIDGKCVMCVILCEMLNGRAHSSFIVISILSRFIAWNEKKDKQCKFHVGNNPGNVSVDFLLCLRDACRFRGAVLSCVPPVSLTLEQLC